MGYSGQISHHFRRLRALLSSRRLLNSFRRSSCGTEPLPLAGPEPEVKPRLPLTPHSRFPAAHRFWAVDFPPDPHGARATSGRAHFRLPPTSGHSPFRSAPRGSPPHFRSSPPSSLLSSLPIGYPSPPPRVIGSLPDTAASDWPSGAQKAPRGSGAAILRRSGEGSGGAVIEWGFNGGRGGLIGGRGGFLRFLAGPALRARFWMGGGRAALGPVRRLR